MMVLPSVEPAIASTNPKFDALYKDLCTNKLNANGSTRLDGKAQNERDTFGKELRKARVEAAKTDLIKAGLEELSYSPHALPEELQELVAIIAALLDGQISEDDRNLLQDDLAKFKENMNPISAALSRRYQQDASTLATLLDLDHPPTTEDLPNAIEKLKDDILASQSGMAKSRLALTREAVTLHELYRQAMETSIRILEQTIHGSVARGTKAKAEYLATVAEGMSKKLNLQHGQLMSQVYSSDVQEALKAKLDALDSQSKAIKRQVRDAEEKLEQYSKAAGMQKTAQEYAEVLKETERIKSEIERLESDNV